MSSEHIEALFERFGEVDVDTPELILSLEMLTDTCVDRRLEFEQENLKRLELDEWGRKDYLRLLGKRENMGEFIHWFGMHATSVLTGPDRPHRKVALELTGTLQYGDWESTAEVDAVPHEAEDQLRSIVPDMTYEPIVAQDCSRFRYTFFPYFNDPDNGDFTFKHGTVMRWRPAADIVIPKMVHLEVYKRTEAMILMDLTDEDTRLALAELSSQKWDHEGNQKNSTASLAAGRAFERAAHEPEGVTKDVIPIGAHYFVSAWDMMGDLNL